MNWLDILANGLAFILGVLGGQELAKRLLSNIFNWIQTKVGKPAIYVIIAAVFASLLWVKNLQDEAKDRAEKQRQEEAKRNLDEALAKERKAQEESEAQSPEFHGTIRPAKDRFRVASSFFRSFSRDMGEAQPGLLVVSARDLNLLRHV